MNAAEILARTRAMSDVCRAGYEDRATQPREQLPRRWPLLFIALRGEAVAVGQAAVSCRGVREISE